MNGRLVAAVLAILVGLVYLVSPIDLIPDIIPFFGMLDDALVVALSIVTAVGLTGSALLLEIRGRELRAPRIAYEPVSPEQIRAL